MSIVDEIKQSYRQGGALIKLIYVNVAVFILVRLLQVFFSFSTGSGSIADYPVLTWISVPTDPMDVLFRPWTLITYMFVHYDFMHIIFNLLYLYWFGRIFLEFFNPRQLLGVYFLGGLSGALLYLLAYNLIPVFANVSGILFGASAAIMAVTIAIARLKPNFQLHLLFIGAVKLKYIALAIFLLDLMRIAALSSNTGGYFSHIGGAVFGYLYTGWFIKGKDVTLGFNKLMDTVATFFSPKSKMKITHKRPMSDMEYNKRKINNQHEVDRILEKIKASGYDSLTSQEKKTLFEASKK